jgi:hypothetical protein
LVEALSKEERLRILRAIEEGLEFRRDRRRGGGWLRPSRGWTPSRLGLRSIREGWRSTRR